MHIIVMLDVSYSMQYYIRDAIMGLNNFVEKLKSSHPNYFLSIVWFHQHYGYITKRVPILEFPFLTIVDVPSYGMTALYDSVQNVVKEWTDQNEYNVSLYVISDGEDNCSKPSVKENATNICKQASVYLNWKITHCSTCSDLIRSANIVEFKVDDIGNLLSNLTL